MRKVLSAACVAGIAGSCLGQVTTFTNRAQWASASGPQIFLENFEGFAQDTSFRTSALLIAAGQGTLTREGVDRGAPFHTIDVPPYGPIDSDTASGSVFAYCFTDSPEGMSQGTQVRLTFNTPIRAFGMDIFLGAIAEGLTLEIIGAANQVLGTITPQTSPTGTFAGFVSADPVASVRFRSAMLVSGSAGEAFGLDNLAGSPIPAPASAAVLLAGLGLIGRRRRG